MKIGSLHGLKTKKRFTKTTVHMEDVLLRREKIQEVVKSYLGLMSTARPCV